LKNILDFFTLPQGFIHFVFDIHRKVDGNPLIKGSSD